MSTKELSVNDPAFWSSSYQKGMHPWDMGGETAVFRGLRERGELPFSVETEGRATRVLIPGCGFGHDAIGYARAGFEVMAVDFAPEPIEHLTKLAGEQRVSLETHLGDIFALPAAFEGRFDAILEYTCYCAIDPSKRAEYIGVLSSSLRSGGYLLALAFPIWDKVEGPPFAVLPKELEAHCDEAGLQLLQSGPSKDSHPARAPHEQLMIFQRR